MAKRAITAIIASGTYDRNPELGQLGLIEETTAKEWARIREQQHFARGEFIYSNSLDKYVRALAFVLVVVLNYCVAGCWSCDLGTSPSKDRD